MTQFKAFGKGDISGDPCSTPRDAAHAFFKRYPSRRVCSVLEGNMEHGRWRTKPLVHRYWRDVSRTQIDALLPDLAASVAA